ncbi:ABC transporter substrate-binding protein [Mesorhizobium loti]|uniref:Peptide ABC transporter substrate-binding protein n=1 Tax=Rhizobium loti TaxID=381 RepID=A0A1A5QPC9_RHILI|nr:ABC transporter substrate-binding protein [Mesorhizobium loti]OBP75080.1 peptide ABC transporter substrate-binding protein [Mesorhizobium loti]OBQ69585.1 peptide ABC transporter substrate-binding protein [Mesorhizobium loti]QKC73258.1 ABC transporter substrate-binding protein [Mesorhizobium loti]
MTITRRDLIKASLAAGTAFSVPSVLRAQTAATAGRTVRMVMGSFPRTFDPMFTTDDTAQSHGLAIYDTLFALDSKFMVQPQMVQKWGVSDDKKTYTFELRDGLSWHDGAAVTAADCVASIRRWAQVQSGGQLMMERTKDISKKDDRTFSIALKEPLGLLPEILASAPPLFIMREKDANRPATEQVTTNIGSGPFKFNEALSKPGASITYDRNEQYVPRRETADGFAGGKVVNVDRVVWENIADQQTAYAALQAGEIDFIQTPSTDLLSVIESDPNLQLEILDKGGRILLLRMNCLQKPFDNVKARQAILHLVDQEAFLQASFGNPKYFRTITSLFGNDTPYSNDENTEWFKKGGDPEGAKRLLNEAGYAGEKIVLLQPTDWTESSNASQLLAAELRKIGANVELAPSDWGGIVERRAKMGSVEEGGWSLFITDHSNYGTTQPHTNIDMVANGKKGWYGWPTSDEYESLRAKWVEVDTLEERQALAGKMQKVYWDFVGMVYLGAYVQPSARRKSLTGLIGMPAYLPMWNMQRVSG